MAKIPWDQRAARIMVRPLATTPITPNQITTLTLLVALTGAVLFAIGEAQISYWGAGLFVTARFLDHFDGELARLKGSASRYGYYYDYAAGALSYTALFLCVGLGLRGGALGGWAIALGLAGAASAGIALVLNLEIDRRRESNGGADAVGYPSFAGFELEDGIYLLAPITWLGWLTPFFVAAGIGAVVYCLWTLGVLMHLGRLVNDCKSPSEN